MSGRVLYGGGRSVSLVAALAALLCASAPALAMADSYIVMADADLADTSDGIVHGRVVEVTGTAVGSTPFTEYRLAVRDVVAGDLVAAGATPGDVAPGEIGVLVLGGRAADGSTLMLHGAPRFSAGEEVLLFLVRHGGALRLNQVLLGAFHVGEAGDRKVVRRSLDGVSVFPLPGRQLDPARAHSLDRAHDPRDLDLFVDWLRDRAAGVERWPDYFVDPDAVGGDGASVTAQFTLLRDSTFDRAFRWTEFDRGESVPWVVNKKNKLKAIKGKGIKQVKNALKEWSKIGNIDYAFDGKVKAVGGGLGTTDGRNTVEYEDPLDEIQGSFSCATGGVLARAGPRSLGATHSKNGKTYWTSTEGDVVFQDGLDCLLTNSAAPEPAANGKPKGLVVEEINGHELGHTLGLGHSCGDGSSPSCAKAKLDEALMRALVHNDGRGAEIGKDDKKGATKKKGLQYR